MPYKTVPTDSKFDCKKMFYLVSIFTFFTVKVHDEK